MGSNNDSKKGKKKGGKETTDGVDLYKVPPFDPEKDSSGRFLEESSFAVMFPRYREPYIREAWPAVTRALTGPGIKCELDLLEGTMTVKTSRKTRDPFVLFKARDLIKLLARSVPFAQAVKILDDDVQADFIMIGEFTSNKERFVKRRQRLIGPNGATLKAIEKLTECYVMVQGTTVAVMGPWKGLRTARQIVEDCMNNVHPVYNIKRLMIQRELAKDPDLATQPWDRFLPQFQTRSQPKKKKAAPAKKKRTGKSLFPALPQPSKMDLELESGEYFVKQAQRRAAMRKHDDQASEAEEEEAAETPYQAKKRIAAEAKATKAQSFLPPKEQSSTSAGLFNVAQTSESRSAKEIAASLKSSLGKHVKPSSSSSPKDVSKKSSSKKSSSKNPSSSKRSSKHSTEQPEDSRTSKRSRV
ncbi:MAG: hypothetical protein Q8P67_22275 [archaeon]|nr:hypothetical protein [archaeon]